MARPKNETPEKLLTHTIIVRVTENDYNKYDKIREKSDCGSIGEVVRRVLGKETILIFQKDTSMDIPMETLTAIQKELKAIGNNMNQITRAYHNSRFESQQLFQLQKGFDQYCLVQESVSKLLVIISDMAKKWLQK